MQVYTVIDIPLMEAVSYETVHEALNGVLGHAFADAISVNVLEDTAFGYNTQGGMARTYANLLRDPHVTTKTRLVVSTLFSTLTGANVAANSITPAALGVVLSNAMSAPGPPQSDLVTVIQDIFVVQHNGKGMTLAQIMLGWGMTVDGVRFNRTCEALGRFPSNGCWEVDLSYYGGGPGSFSLPLPNSTRFSIPML
jgi:hypothetical protein